MDFEPFDKDELEQYQLEARERWGSQQAYQEYAQRQQRKTPEQNTCDHADVMVYIQKVAALRHLPPESAEVQQAVKNLQDMFTRNFYNCTNEILYGLGEMYVSDDRFHQNIDKECGKDAAMFIRDAIRCYCRKAE